jgi:2-amino-4-hydroxy-6-hydroxymethyldihydropteridine diphosphokinase
MKKIFVYIGVGSNLDDRCANIRAALCMLEAGGKVEIVTISRIIESEPQGGPPQGDYLNGVIKLKTLLGAHALLRFLKSIERRMGRKKTVRFGPRIIDLDILLYGDKILTSKTLTVPHPRMFERAFVMEPLKEVAAKDDYNIKYKHCPCAYRRRKKTK